MTKILVTFVAVLQATIFYILCQDVAAAEVHRAEADLTLLKTHGYPPHLHAKLTQWHPLARMEIDDVFPGEIWQATIETTPRHLGDRMSFVTRVIACTQPCGVYGYAPEPGEYEVIALSGVETLELQQHRIISRNSHWVVPDALSGHVYLEFQVLFYSVPYGPGFAQGEKVFFTPEQQWVSVLR